jgi:protein-tyrosine phosphatase
MINNILLVCVGNICRSPMAEGLFKQYIVSQKLPINISSAGTNACVAQAAHPIAQQLMLEKGIDISHHRARQITQELVVASDLILVMEETQLQAVKSNFPFTQGRVHTLGKWSRFEIPDPLYRSREEFETVLKLMEQGTREWQSKLWK